MSLTDLTAQLAAHMAARPVQPGPVRYMTDEQYTAWSHALARWADKRDLLLGLVEGIPKTQPLNREPACTPRADYYYRGQMPRKRKAA